MLKTATIVGRGHRSRTLLILSFAHFLKTFSHHSVLFFVFSFSLLSFNSTIYSSSTISKRDAIVIEKHLLDWIKLLLGNPRNSLCYRGVVFHLYFHNILLLDYSVKRPSNGTIYLGTWISRATRSCYLHVKIFLNDKNWLKIHGNRRGLLFTTNSNHSEKSSKFIKNTFITSYWKTIIV